jgi:hypothetical protein
MGAALSEALIPVWREPVTMTSSKSLSAEVGVSANSSVVGNAAPAQSSAMAPRNLNARGRSSHRGKELRASLLAMSIWHPFMLWLTGVALLHRAKRHCLVAWVQLVGQKLRRAVETSRKPANQEGFMPVRPCIS